MNRIAKILLSASALFFMLMAATPAQAASGRQQLLDDQWIILQVWIPFPGCSLEGASDYVKCCNDSAVKQYVSELNDARRAADRPEISCFPQNSVVAVKNAPGFVVVLSQFAMIMLSMIIVILLMIAGVQYMISGGDPSKAKAATDKAKKAAASLVVALFAVVILNQINPALTSLSIPGIVPIEEEPFATACPEAYQTFCGDPVPGQGACRGLECDGQDYCKVEGAEYTCTPQVATGRPCTSDEMCKSGACKPLNSDPTKSECFSLQTEIAAACSETNPCEGGLICQTDSAPNHCTMGHLGNPCDEDSQCDTAKGYVCNTNLGAGVCIQTNTAYSICSDNKQCPAGYSCEDGSYGIADNDIDTCLPQNPSDTTKSVKVTDCNSNNDCLNNPNDPLATYCNTDGDHFCHRGLAGSPCAQNDQCKTKYCATGPNICTNGIVGDICDNNSDCASEFCYKGYCIGKEN